MIYLFYSALALAAVISIGTIKAQIAHIKGLKQMYKGAVRKGNLLLNEKLDAEAKLRECIDAKQTWARLAHEASEDLNYMTRVHAGELDAMRLQIYQAEQFMHRVREQKRRCERKRREAKNAASKN
jgi:hypothetical protein